MTSHRRVKNVDFDDEYEDGFDDYEEEASGDADGKLAPLTSSVTLS